MAKRIKVLGTMHCIHRGETKAMLSEVKEYLSSLDLRGFDVISETGFDKSKFNEEGDILFDDYVLNQITTEDTVVKNLDVKGGIYNNGGETILQDVLDNVGDQALKIYGLLGKLFGIEPKDVLGEQLEMVLTAEDVIRFVVGKFTSGDMIGIDSHIDEFFNKMYIPFLDMMESRYGIKDESVLQEFIRMSKEQPSDEKVKDDKLDKFISREEIWDLPLDDEDKVFVVGSRHIVYIENYYRERGFEII